MAVSEELIAYVLAVVNTVFVRIVAVLAQELLLLVDECIECFQRIARIILELNVEEFHFFAKDIFHCARVGMLATEDLSGLVTSHIFKQLSILVEK